MLGYFATLSRRRFLLATGSLAATGWMGRTGPASSQVASPPATSLPRRVDFVVRGAQVLSMDRAIGDIANGDVHVRDGAIVAVGPNLAAPGAEVIDGRGTIVLPGLIDTHDHLWNSTLRNLVQEGPEKGYFATTLALGKHYSAHDSYCGVRLGVAELIYSGITTVHDWAHNIRSPDHADAELRALMTTGIRARFSYGTWQGGPPPDQTMDLSDLARVHRQWDSFANDGLISLGVASRSISTSPRGAVTMAAIHRDWDAAREFRLPISLHTGGKGVVTLLEQERLLGPDVQLINSTAWDETELATVVRSGAHVSMSPFSELRYSYALPQLLELLKSGLPVSLAVDTPPVAGTTDLFAQMRSLMDTQFVRSKDPMSVTARQILEMATVNGAYDLGISGQVGTLTPGKRADLILVRATDLNMAPLGDPVTAIVRSAQPHNVDTVVVDGRILKRNGQLTALDPAEIVRDATQSLFELRQHAHWT
jgi:5-methylthioadenosine/S-adenosylhomocysteine deaminase